jgi:hypothetical protein
MFHNKLTCKTKDKLQFFSLYLAMIDSIGGSGKVNNMLSTLNIAPSK